MLYTISKLKDRQHKLTTQAHPMLIEVYQRKKIKVD
jgi:hypothetical protein